MSEPKPIQGIVLTHGGLAGGLVDAVSRISGVGPDALRAVSNDGKSPDVLQAELAEILEQGGVLVFTDLPSGSCALAARICCRQQKDSAVVFGVNLAMLLDFVFHRDLPLKELVPRLLEKGRGSLSSLPDFSNDAHRTSAG